MGKGHRLGRSGKAVKDTYTNHWGKRIEEEAVGKFTPEQVTSGMGLGEEERDLRHRDLRGGCTARPEAPRDNSRGAAGRAESWGATGCWMFSYR